MLVQFTSTQVLTTPSQGQARIESAPAKILNNLNTTIPGFDFSEAVFNLDDNAGNPTGAYEDFITGLVISDKRVWGRPVGVAVAKDGSPFVSEDGNGTIWRVTYQPAVSR